MARTDFSIDTRETSFSDFKTIVKVSLSVRKVGINVSNLIRAEKKKKQKPEQKYR